MRIVLFDIDHTITNATWRDSMMPPNNTWDKYHELGIQDTCYDITRTLINTLFSASYVVVGFTMRPEKWRAPTNSWMLKHGVYLEEVLMRANNDWEPANTAKVKLVKDFFTKEQMKSIQFIVDDREDVCKMFTDELKISSLQIRHAI